MQLRVSEIATLIGANIVGNPDFVVKGVAPFEEATHEDITFVSDKKYEGKIHTTRASVIITDRDYKIKDKTFLIVSRPQVSFATLLEYIQKEQDKDSKKFNGIHPTTVISDDVSIGKDVIIEPYVVVCSGVKIGDKSVIGAGSFIGEKVQIGKGATIHPNVVIYERCIVGDRVIIHSSSVIGSDGFGYIPLDKSIKKIPQLGIVRIGDEVEIGSNVSIDRATIGETVIGEGTKIDNLSHIAHNVRIGKRCLIAAGAGIAGSVIIGDGVIMGGQAGVRDHVKIGNGAIIAARAGVIGDVKEGETVSGFPARPHSKMMKLYALIERLPEILERIKKLENK